MTSDDGSKLFVDRVLVIENCGIHGMTVKTVALDLEVGPEAIALDNLQDWGPSGMIISGLDQIRTMCDRSHPIDRFFFGSERGRTM